MHAGLRSLVLVLVVASAARAQPAAGPAGREPAYYAPDPVLRDYVERALAANPSVDEAFALARAADRRVAQAAALPDPVLTVGQAIRRPETRVGPQVNTLTLSQTFPWAGTRGLQAAMAGQEAEAAHEMHLARQREVIAAVKRAYYELAYVDAALAISREERDLLAQYEGLAQSRYAAGQGLMQAVLRIQAEITAADSRLDTLAQQRVSTAVRLNTLMNRLPDTPVPPVARPVVPAVALDPYALTALAEARRHELIAARALVERADRAVDLAKKDPWPDVAVAMAYANILARDVAQPPPDNGRNSLSFSVGVTLPLWRAKYRAGIERATEERLARRRGVEALRNDIAFAVRDRVARADTLRRQSRLFADVLIPEAAEAVRSTEAAYQTGQVAVLDLLDGERTLLQVRLSQARQATDCLIALTDLELALGTQVPDMEAP